MRSLFEPRGVIVAGASSHPGKFGFTALHNILAHGYAGNVFATNRDGGEILGVPCAREVDEIPAGEADLVMVCTPAVANEDLLRRCAAKGVRAAFVASAGYREAGAEGRAAEERLVALAAELGMLLAGPNGQGLVSTPVRLCAQIVGPYPPAGRLSITSQSGNFVSSLMNYAVQTGIGVARAVSAGNAAALGVGEYLDWFAGDDATGAAVAYVEHVADGRALTDALHRVSARKPVVVVKGGATEGGARAAASHTGALATSDRVFDGAVRQAGAVRAATIEEAFDIAATFATQPLPSGPNVVVVTTVGGWGVVTADAIERSSGSGRSRNDDRSMASAVTTPHPPTVVTTATLGPDGNGWVANVAATSKASSIVAALTAPAWRTAPSNTRSDVARAPVCDAAARAPPLVAPPFTITTGLRRLTRCVASTRARPSATCST